MGVHQHGFKIACAILTVQWGKENRKDEGQEDTTGSMKYINPCGTKGFLQEKINMKDGKVRVWSVSIQEGGVWNGDNADIFVNADEDSGVTLEVRDHWGVVDWCSGLKDKEDFDRRGKDKIIL